MTIRGVSGSITATPGGGEVVVEAVKTARRSDPDDVTVEVIEDAEDLIADLERGLRAAARAAKGR